MGQRTLGSELAIPLARSVSSPSVGERGRSYLHEVLAWRLLCHWVHRMREGTRIPSLTSTLSKELARHVFRV